MKTSLIAHDPRAPMRRTILKTGASALAGALFGPLTSLSGRAANDTTTGPMLLKGGMVLSMDPSNGELTRGDVLIRAGKIAAVAREIPTQDAQIIDATGMIVMPGFVDTHRHMWQGLIRNIGPDDLLGDYLAKVLFGFAPRMTPEEVRLGDLVTGLAALNAGITSILDWSHIGTSPTHTDAAIDGLRASGIRAVYAYGPNFGIQPAWFENPNSPYPNDIRRLRRQHFSGSDQLLTLAIAAAGPEFSSPEAAAREWNIAREVGARISVHVGVGLLGKQGKLQALAAKVPFKDDTTYIHCCTLNDAEWDLIAGSGGSVSLAIPIEMQMGHGMPPIQKCLDLGLRPSLSVDVETNQPPDMFTQMRACFALQRALINEKNLFGGPEPDRKKLLGVRDVLQLATIEGAKANGLGAKTGSLTPGKEADIVLLRTSPNTIPVNDSAGAVVLAMDTSNVESVFVAGKAVKRNGQLVGVDVARLQREADAARLALIERVRAAAK